MASSPSTFPFLFPPTRPAYTPDTGFFPAPDPSPSTAPSIFSTTTAPCTLTSSCVRLSPPPPAETPVTAPTGRPAKVHHAHIPSRSSSSTTPNREYQTPQSHASYTPSDPIPTYTPHTYRSSSKTSRRRPPSTLHPSPRSEASSLLEIPVETPLFALPVVGGPVLTEMEPVLYASTTQRNKQNTSTAASMPRSFSGTTSGSSASSDVPAPTPLFGFTSSSVSAATSTTSSQCSSAPSISPSPATSSVAQQMFGEMPTPRLEYENYSSGNPNKIQSSCVQGGSNNPYEHDLDGQPHHYGFDNLKRQTVIRADGTEHSFYGLPENYLLDRATLGPLFDAYDDDMDGCSTELVDVFLGTPEQQKSDQFANCFCEALNAFSKDTPERVSHAYDVNTKGCTDESVHVFINPPEQQPYEGERQESGQLPKCFSKASEIVLPFQHPPMSATATDQMHQMQFQASKSMLNYDVYEKEDSTCINIISGVRDFTIELQQQNDERACHCPVMTASDSLVTRSSQLSVDHSMSRLRLLWDPGALAPLHSSKAEPARELGYVAMLVPEVMSLCIQDGSYVQKLRDSSCSVLVTHQRRKEWHPGEDTIPRSTSTRDNRFYCGVPSRLINHGIQFFWDPGILNQMHIMPLVLSASYKEVTGGCLADQELMSNTSCKVATFTWHSSVTTYRSCLHPKVNITEIDTEEVVVKVNGGNSIISPGRPTGGIFSFTNEMKPDTGLLVVCFNNTSDNAFSEEAPDFTFPHGPGILYELWWLTKGTGYVLRHLLAVKFGTHNYTSFIDTAASMCWRPANLVQQIRNIAALLPFHQCILLSSAVCLWDPGIAISSYMYSWLEMTVVKTSTWLQSPLPMNKTSSVWDPGIESLYFSCNRLNITKLIQIKGWTSMTYNGIFLSEYTYILIFLHDQWKLVRRGVHETDRAKHMLLSSPIYLQNREMNIFFITFLPP